MPKHKEIIYDTPNLYRSIGFVLGRLQTMVAFIPWKAKEDFNDKFYDATGRLPYPDEQGLIIHPKEVNKYWTECRITFQATRLELSTLFLGYNWVVEGADSNHWNINNNNLFFKLLSLGFQLGTKQSIETIKAKIPTQFTANFEEGLAKAQKG